MEDFDIFGIEAFFFFSTLLRVSKQCICNSICPTLAVINLEVITRKFLNLADLSEAQTLLCIHEFAKVVMDSKDKDLLFATF